MMRRNTEFKRFCAAQLMQVSTLEPIEFCIARVYWLISSAVVCLGRITLPIGMLAMTSSKFTRLTLVNSLARECRPACSASRMFSSSMPVRAAKLTGCQTLLIEQVAVGAVAVDDGRVREHFGQCFAAFKFVFDNLDCNAGIQQDFRKKVRDFAAADQHCGGNALDRQTDLLENSFCSRRGMITVMLSFSRRMKSPFGI